MAREWRTPIIHEDLSGLSPIQLLRLIQTKVTQMDDGHPGVKDMDEAMRLLHDMTAVMVAAMVVIQKLATEVNHLRAHLTEGDIRDN